MPKTAEDLTGQIFGTRKVVGKAGTKIYNGKSTLYWHTTCLQCGLEKEIQGGQLRRELGCSGCRKENDPALPRAQSKRKVVSKKDRGLIVTLGDLRKLISDLPDRIPVEIRKLSERGYTFTVMIKDDR